MDLTEKVTLEVEWADPPPMNAYKSPSHRRHDIMSQFRAALVEYPGRWALYPLDGIEPFTLSKAKSHARSINGGYGPWGVSHYFEAVLRHNRLYVRYTGLTRAPKET